MWTSTDIERTTSFNARKMETLRKNLKKYDEDKHKDRRLVTSTCKRCYYIHGGKIVTQAFTNYVCRSCNQTHTHHNGDTPLFCSPCSTQLGICRECGGKMD